HRSTEPPALRDWTVPRGQIRATHIGGTLWGSSHADLVKSHCRLNYRAPASVPHSFTTFRSLLVEPFFRLRIFLALCRHRWQGGRHALRGRRRARLRAGPYPAPGRHWDAPAESPGARPCGVTPHVTPEGSLLSCGLSKCLFLLAGVK